MICPRRTKSINPFGKPVDCRYYIKVTKDEQVSEDQWFPYSIGFCSCNDQFLCIEDIPARVPRLSHSSVSDFMDCRRLYYLKHIRGIEKIPARLGDALKMGVLWDAVVQMMIGELKPSDITDLVDKYEMDEKDVVAKVRGVYKAFKELDVKIDPFGKTQPRFMLPLHYPYTGTDFLITGVYDRLYDKHFVETKFSRNVEFYTSLYSIAPQVGTYFLANPNMEYCIMEVVRTPDLKSTRSHEGESDKDLEDRIRADVVARPAWYFKGWDAATKTFGVKFYRSEFNLKEIEDRYAACYYEIADCAHRDAFYKNHKRCLRPWKCEFIDICQFDNMSETQFRIKKKPKEVDGVDYEIAKTVEEVSTIEITTTEGSANETV